MVPELTRFYGKPHITSSSFSARGRCTRLHNGFWKSDDDFLVVNLSNFLAAMHDFRDKEVLLPTGCDVIVSPPPGGVARTISWQYWKSDHDFLIAFHSNVLATMHGFWDNEIYCKPNMASSWLHCQRWLRLLVYICMLVIQKLVFCLCVVGPRWAP